MPVKSAAPLPRKGLLLRMLRILAWLLIVVSLVCVVLYLAFGPAHLIDRLKPPTPVFPEEVIEAPEPAVAASPVPAPTPPPTDTRELVQLVMDSSENIWGELLARGDFYYRTPKLEIYEGRDQAGCKDTGTVSGPFYCMDGKRLFIDLAFLDELGKRIPEASAFARSYVVAHEIGHHIENLTGVTSWIKDVRERGGSAADLLASRELLADCLVGSWMSYAQRTYTWMKPDEMNDVFRAVKELTEERAKSKDQPPMADPMAVGDLDTRMEWFRQGLESGDPRECTQLLTGTTD